MELKREIYRATRGSVRTGRPMDGLRACRQLLEEETSAGHLGRQEEQRRRQAAAVLHEVLPELRLGDELLEACSFVRKGFGRVHGNLPIVNHTV